VANTPPNTPEIIFPGNGDTVSANCAINLRGRASDHEDGEIPGEGLVWRSKIGNTISELGYGNEIEYGFKTPGQHVIRLTAIDSSKAESNATIAVSVQPSNKGCAPKATIISPTRYAGHYVNVESGSTVWFEGHAEDDKDSPDKLALKWTYAQTFPAVFSVIKPLGTDNTKNVVEATDLVAREGKQTMYAVKFTVTDQDGNTGQDEIIVNVLPFIVK
jgi:hypothetical protein